MLRPEVFFIVSLSYNYGTAELKGSCSANSDYVLSLSCVNGRCGTKACCSVQLLCESRTASHRRTADETASHHSQNEN